MIAEVYGNIFDPPKDLDKRPKCIIHQCNNRGGWGRGFVVELSRRWKAPEEAYRSKGKYILGDVQLVDVEDGVCVANIIGQNGYGNSQKTGIVYTHYLALEMAFVELSNTLPKDCVVHTPLIGCGLAGGDWNVVKSLLPLIEREVIVFRLK